MDDWDGEGFDQQCSHDYGMIMEYGIWNDYISY